MVLLILGLGMGIAIDWSMWTSWVLNQGYPESYILAGPFIRFSDFTDNVTGSTLRNPYDVAWMNYPPSTYLFLRMLNYEKAISLIFMCYLSLLSLALLLIRLLRPIVPNAWNRVTVTFLFLALSYPVLFCFDRGNIEIMLAPLIGWALYYFNQRQEIKGSLCLLPAIFFKLYPALFLVLLLRRRKVGLAFLCGCSAMILIGISFLLFPDPPSALWSSYLQNIEFYNDYYVLCNNPLEASASPWITYKILLITLQNLQLISPVNFGFDGPLIVTSYRIYSLIFALITATCVAYAWFYERTMERSSLVLLLLLSISAPSGGDYRLIYASMALALIVLLKQRRRGDWVTLVLISLALIPKKEILLPSIGMTETLHFDVSIQSIFNPILILLALCLLLYHSKHEFDWKKAGYRFLELLPSRWHGL